MKTRNEVDLINKHYHDLMIEREKTSSILTAFGNASTEDAIEKIHRDNFYLVNEHSYLLRAKYSALKRIRRIKLTAFNIEPIQYLN